MASEDLRGKEEELKQHKPTTFKGELASKNDKTHNVLLRMICPLEKDEDRARVSL